MAQNFECDICGVGRTESDGAGQWFTLGINDYGRQKQHRKLHIYGWPLGCRSQQDDIVQHGCSISHLLELVTKWAERAESLKEK